ncbi:endonuclease/exonuclease/phosphatase family protein [Candidatus Soleaferrea massiliensis]|uniref:endonuclease/exonuclease/phosphatase family protein n=1 Tax=Candidatus Soleaferrea massiliensis TaxID=1470354 RepID=UPI00058B4C7D|nr:endonuclease/exonuclease/phosphatase family protein [Candidatus Soleaferrea massiliensis]
MTDNQFTVVSFNVKRDGPFTYLNKWENRKYFVANIIKSAGASIVGVQEMMPEMREDLQNLLCDYGIFGISRRKNNRSEHSDVMVNNTQAEMRYYHTFWLSKKPEKAGSRAYYAAFPRICTVAEVYVKAIGRTVRVFNTHFDHICSSARTLGIKTILHYLKELDDVNPMPTILMGDFNAKPGSKPLELMKKFAARNPRLGLHSVFDSYTGITNTHHNFKGKMNHTIIDYIFVSNDLQVVRAVVDKSAYGGRYPSDHFPIVATLRLKQQTGSDTAYGDQGTEDSCRRNDLRRVQHSL